MSVEKTSRNVEIEKQEKKIPLAQAKNSWFMENPSSPKKLKFWKGLGALTANKK